MHPISPSRGRGREVGAADRAIASLAGAQHGVVSRRQLLAIGISEDAVKWRLRTRRLHRLHQGVYLVGHRQTPPRAREMAAQLACGPRALISHVSAAVLWLLVEMPTVVGLVDVTVVGRHAKRQPGIRLHRLNALPRRDAIRQGRLWLTRPARTVLDLAAVLDAHALEDAVAQGRRKRLVREADLHDQLVRNFGRTGAGRLRRLLELERGAAFTRSKAERKLLRLVRAASLPAPETNALLHGYEVDLLWAAQRLVVEFDSRTWHSDPLAFGTDRLRDAELAAHGYVVVRVTWRQLTQEPEAVTARLRLVLEQRSGPNPPRTGTLG